MKKICVLTLFLLLPISIVAVEKVWGLPYDVEPPKCYFCCDVNYDGQVDLRDVALVARSFGSTKDMSNWNSHADVNGDGIVNLLDVVLVLRFAFSKVKFI